MYSVTSGSRLARANSIARAGSAGTIGSIPVPDQLGQIVVPGILIVRN